MAEEKVNLYDFYKMTINLSKVAVDQLVVEVFPELLNFPIYTEATDEEIRVAIFMVDRYGPFSGIKKFPTRLDAIFKWLKYDREAEHRELFESVSLLKNDHVSKIWTVYLEDMFDHEWTTWYSLALMYYQMMEQIRKPIDWSDEKKSDAEYQKRMSMESKATNVYERIKTLENVLFVDDAIKRRSYETRKEMLIENFAEKHAEIDSVQ